MPIPMLADFGVRLASGLAVLLLATPWRVVPVTFFRTHCQVILGLLVLAALDLSRASTAGPALTVVVATAVLGYLASIAWGLGLPRVAIPFTALIALGCGATIVAASKAPDGEVWALHASERLASAFLMGSTLTAMLLGHHYLTAPTMSTAPLRRFVRCMAWALSTRALLAALGWWSGIEEHAATMPNASVPLSPLLLRNALGDGVRRAGPRHCLDLEDGPDPRDAVGDGNPLYCVRARAVR